MSRKRRDELQRTLVELEAEATSADAFEAAHAAVSTDGKIAGVRSYLNLILRSNIDVFMPTYQYLTHSKK